MQPCVFQRKRLHGFVNTNTLILFSLYCVMDSGIGNFYKKQNNEG